MSAVSQVPPGLCKSRMCLLGVVIDCFICSLCWGKGLVMGCGVLCRFLLTIPASVGYEQNPLSVYYCFDVDDSGSHLAKCIAEVTLPNNSKS